MKDNDLIWNIQGKTICKLGEAVAIRHFRGEFEDYVRNHGAKDVKHYYRLKNLEIS